MIDFPYLAYDYEAFKHIYTLASHLRRGKGAYNDKKKKGEFSRGQQTFQ